MTRFAALTTGAAIACAAGATAQPPPRPAFGTSTSAVVVDVVVRDRQGRPITVLAIKDFELLEDGVPQRCSSAATRCSTPISASRSPPTRRRR